ncbi:beta-ketoacyl synthase N-terminal-like domain-containing protein [Lysobacter brunescens]|uniref:Beta-ketoacyl synthase N-terminal-like domain-containing protein n=1 Tax=Lysobacter brunescens TaxID=262323 RepID=A0ABW2YKN7_9GAMM
MNASDKTAAGAETPLHIGASDLEAARLPVDAERLATTLVAAQLRALFADAQGDCMPAEMVAGLRPAHGRWLDASLRHLERHGLLSFNGLRCRFAAVDDVETLWQAWDAAMPDWCGNANHRAYLILIDACLRNLTEILKGTMPATDVMFPESSMRMVEGIYKHNPVADHFNHALGEQLRAELAARAARSERGLRLLEIGAGTGGTTAVLLPILRGFGDLVEEYCYTDLSRAFLLHAQEVYRPTFPALRTAIFDVGKPLSMQSVEGNRYDAVIATNVLHATSNMRETMRNAKALLKRGGVVLINEISEWGWYTHFTFGLLDGWWLFEDEALRLPGSPCLSPGQWERLLKLERFRDIRFPVRNDHGLGQQLVVARSDGVVRQRLAPRDAVADLGMPAPVSPQPTVITPTAPIAATTDDAALREACTTRFREIIATALRMGPREIEPHRPLEQYGLDSILVVQLTTRFRALFPDVRSTLFFEVKTVDGLVQHFLEKDRSTVVSVLAGSEAATGLGTPQLALPTVPSKPTVQVSASAAAVMTPAAPIDASDEAGLRDACTTLFRGIIATALRMDPREIESHRPLEQYGLDSILVVQLTTQFRTLFPGVRSTLFFEVQSIDGLVRHFFEKERATVASVLAGRGIVAGNAAPQVGSPSNASSGDAAVAPTPRSQPPGGRVERRRLAPRRPDIASVSPPLSVETSSTPTDAAPQRSVPFDVAIIGVSGRYPQSPDLDRFWENLSSGRSCIGEVPADRWHWQDHYDAEKGKSGKIYTRWGGFIGDVDKFDPLFFRIAPREAKKIDPQERLFLEASYHAIEDSGHTPQSLSPGGKVGVFVGVMNSRYTVQPLYYSIANRVSFLFDFSGPSFAVDSACSSSLTAIHLALDSLYGGLCDAAIAGGVSLILDPQHMIELSALGMLSEGAECRSFGENADGFVDAEGVGAIVLKPLAHALRDGDHIHAVIKASALNAGGRTHGYTVPNPVAQADVVSTALARAGIDSTDVSYLEAHGTGTALGDPIEVAGLTRAFRERGRADAAARGPHCAIGSLKSNIGHCESAAGIAGLTKVLLQLRHGQLVPTLHAERVNDEIDFEATPFRLQRELGAWRRPIEAGREIPRIAGISSFGAGGANAHLIVQEAPMRDVSRTVAGPWLVPLSARTADQLQEKIRQLAAFLRRQGNDIDPAALAYTLQVGREAMDERIVLQVDAIDDLRRQLEALADGRSIHPQPQQGSVRRHREFLAACRADAGFAARRDDWLARRDLASIAEHWAKGVDIDWSRLYGDVRPVRMPLPTYPFARERHWIAPQRTLGQATGTAAKHPLLQRNTSTLRHPAYGIELKGDERVLVADADDRRRLPALLCLEMARAAVAEAYPDELAARALCFEGIALDDDLRIEPGCMLQIALLPDGNDALRFEVYSVQGGQERIHAQGLARFADAETATQAVTAGFASRLAGGLAADAFHARIAALGLGDRAGHAAARRIARTAREALLEYAVADTASAGWDLPPDLLVSLIDGAAWLSAELGPLPASPCAWPVRAIDAVRFHGRCPQQGYLQLRCTDTFSTDAGISRWDAIVCDLQGHPAFEIQGLQLACVPAGPGVGAIAATMDASTASVTTASVSTPAVASPAVETPTPAPVLPEAGRRIAFLRARPSVVRAAVPLDKPQALCLPEADASPGFDAAPVPRPTIMLPSPALEAHAADASSDGLPIDADAAAVGIDLRALGDGVYALCSVQDTPTGLAIDQMLQALDHVRGLPDAKVLLLDGLAQAFPSGEAVAVDAAIAAGLPGALLAFPLPTIAALPEETIGAGFLLAALCDFMIGAHDARYGFADPQRGLLATDAEAELLEVRFGAAQVDDLLYIGGVQSGRALVAKGWTFPVVERAQVASTAVALAASIAAKPRTSLELLKARLVETLAPQVERLGRTPRPQVAQATPRKSATTATRERSVARAGLVVDMLSATVASIRIGLEARELPKLLADLRATLQDLATQGHAALVLRSDHPGFLPAVDPVFDTASVVAAFDALQASVASFPAPVVVAFEQDAEGLGWLLGLGADAGVHDARSRCSAEALWRDPLLLRRALPLFARRLGDNLARQCLFGAASMATAAIEATALTAAAAHVAADAPAAALALVDGSPLRSHEALQQWRRHRAAAINVDVAAEPLAGERRAAPLPSSPAIETELRDNGVLVVRMVDRDAKNMYSPALIGGLEEVFAHIDGCDDYRAVVLTGYDTYFACGGTRDSLLAIQQGAAKFTDAKVYQLPMSCRVPVIAAMQGHAIGGGWTLGMFADLCLFSAESRYISPYMQYGFTPGAGATLVFPTRLGLDLARETLFTASEYTGIELRGKGLPHVCVPRADVLPRALALADAIASQGREDAIAVKRHFSASTLAEVEATYARELEMHDRSFVGRGDALQGVMQHFRDDRDTATVPVTVEPAIAVSLRDPAASVAVTPVALGMDIDGIADVLRSMLASELQMRAEDVDEDTQFVDLGLDSITGVTWVRRINATYGTKIEATKVYSHPTLRQFRDFVVALVSAHDASMSRTAAPLRSAPAVAPVAVEAIRVDAEVGHAEERDDDLCETLRRMLAQELHMAEEEVDDHRQFVELGLDSITGVTWVRRINATYGTKIEATKVYSHPNLAEFSRFLAGLLPARPASSPVPGARVAPLPAATPATSASRPLPSGLAQAQRLDSWRKRSARRSTSIGNDAIAVIGIAGQFPRAKTLDAFWRNIAGAKECIDLVPAQRFDIERYFSEDISVPGTTNSRWMGVLDDCDAFDPLFFNIAPTEAESMDPQQRLMLQNCWHAIENAAIDPRSLSGTRCGVFVGCGSTDYHDRSREHRLSTQGFTGSAMSILAARIAYFLNLQGPCLSIDTACSSSLVAIATACDSLLAQNCDLALAGGVAVMAGPTMHVNTGQSGMLSVDGRCYAFDHRANGFVPAEGVGTVLLKRLADAERDGDIVHAVIRGWGVNQDGKTNGITAPNPVSQTRLMRTVYDRFGIDPEDIQLIEAHGTGTRLGDPIEVEGLTQAFRHYTDKTQYCALGSVKGNVGHCLFAAGIAGVLKLVLALKHRQLPPAASFERLNPHIDLSDSPFVVNTALKPWPTNARGGRAAVISSFGFSGTNAHLVLEAAPERTARTPRNVHPERPVLVPLSAKTPEQLRQRAQDLSDALTDALAADDAPSLLDIAYTLQVGREAMQERCALVARTHAELQERLRAFAEGATPRGLHVGSTLARANKLAFIGQDGDLQAVLIETCLREGKLDKLAELWVDGVELPWPQLYRELVGATRPQRIELPLYPFAKERYWLDDDAAIQGQVGARATGAIHPLVHANASTLRQQRYISTFDGSEFFLRDHRVRFGDGRVECVLPGVAYLEMAAAAIADALADDAGQATGLRERLVLGNVAWWRPLFVDGPTTVEIEIGADEGDMILFEIASGSGDTRILHCQGEAGVVDAVGERTADASLLAAAQRDERWDGDEIYAAFNRGGLHYGPAHRGLRSLSRTGGKVVATVTLAAQRGDVNAGIDAYRMHPGVMDAVLQACVGFLPSLQALPQAPSVPFALRSLTLHAPCPADAVAVLTPIGTGADGTVETCDVSIFDADGALCIDIRGFAWRSVERTRTATVVPADDTDDAGMPAFDEAFYRELLDSLARQEMSAEEAAELGLSS